MKKLLMKLSIAVIAISGLSGCGTHDIDVAPSQTAYVYQKDIADSDRYNGGSDYVWVFPLEADYKTLIIDYGTASSDYPINFNLTTKENKTRIKATATVIYRLIRNPNDKDGSMEFNEDEYVKFYAQNITAEKVENNLLKIDAYSVYSKYMIEHLDKSFRTVFTDSDTYPDFDSVESNIENIQVAVKDRLTAVAENAKIEIIGVRISDVEVPKPIQDSRDTMLKLQQDELNQKEELQIKSRTAAHRMAVDVREAINQVTIDKIAGQTNKSYMFIKTLNRAIDEKAPLQLSITPDFMRYLDESKGSGNNSTNADLINQISNMSDEELVNYFNKNKVN